MGTTTEELKKLYSKLGGKDSNIPKASTPGEVLNGINELDLHGGFSGDYNDLTNKPPLGTASPKDVAASGDASSSQVVMGNDSRLTNRRGSTWGQINGTLANQTDLKGELDDIDNRIDSIIALPDGSTTADAELVDIRNGVHGQTFNSAGDAVRASAEQLYNMKTGFDGVTYPSPVEMVQGCDEYVESELYAAVDNKTIESFFEANPVFASGSHTNIINLQSQSEGDYSNALKYSVFGFKSIITTANQNYWFNPSFVSGAKYRIYIHYFGETNQYGISNIRLYRGDTMLKQFNNVGDNYDNYEFTSDGTEKFKIYVSDPSVFELYSLLAIKVATAFSTDFLNMLAGVVKNPLQYGGHVTTANYSTLLPDLNDAPVNTYYTVFTNSTSILPANCPLTTSWPYIVETYGTNGYVVFQKFTIFTNSSSLYSGQLMGTTWYRALTGTPGSRVVFYPWRSAEDIQATHIKAIENEIRPVVTVDKNATPNETNLLYNNFYKAMKYAYNNNCDVNVKAGNYDLVSEYIAVEGQSAYDAIANVWKGTPIGHGMKVKCAAEAYFTMKNTSDTSANYLTIGQWLSPILPLDGGFVLEGWNCDAKNCRYAIHDGGYNNLDVFCNHEIINCQMKLDNTDFEGQPGLQTYKQCIGGGLLSGGVHVIVRNCIFESKNFADNAGIVSYHNVSDTQEGATSYNTYDISGCYCKNGTVRCTYHGTETPVSLFKVHDNFLRANPIIGAEVPGTDTIVNMELLEWNNTVVPSA